MPVILDDTQAPSLTQLLQAIPESRVLVSTVVAGCQFSEACLLGGIGPLKSAGAKEISFIVSAKYSNDLAQTSAAVVMMPQAVFDAMRSSGSEPPYTCVITEQPYLLYALVARWFDRARHPKPVPSVHKSACVADLAQISPKAWIGPNVVIGARSVIGDDVQIHANTTIGADCVVGAGTVVHANVSFYDHTVIGQACIIHSGVVLGADGFGFAPNPTAAKGAWGKIAQLGGVRIGNDVEIGANTTIDRGALDDTVIGDGVKLDNQIMIAHNCQIGDYTAMAACVGVAGSTSIGARCIIGGAAMFSGHLTITDDVQVSGGTAITSDISQPGRYTGVLPFGTHAEWQRNAAVYSQLSGIRRRLRELERK
jgi:UDP-3-O-[3-hydroxymyristoyl] glucosamine N-acyltransferase